MALVSGMVRVQCAALNHHHGAAVRVRSHLQGLLRGMHIMMALATLYDDKGVRLTRSAAMAASSSRSVLFPFFFCSCLARGDMKPLPTVGMPPFSAAL
jgi:hypothetical protein